MKKIIILTFLVLLIFSCKKESIQEKPPIEEEKDLNIDLGADDDETGINFVKMERIVENSRKMNIEVFFAISVLHKKYVLQFIDEYNDMDDQKKKIFFDMKREEFFEKIKYTDKEYYDFMDKNTHEMNLYIKEHKEIEEYLTSIN